MAVPCMEAYAGYYSGLSDESNSLNQSDYVVGACMDKEYAQKYRYCLHEPFYIIWRDCVCFCGI